MVDLACEALHWWLYQWLAIHVCNQVLNRGQGLLAKGLSLEVDWNERASLYKRMRQEDLEEEGQLLATLFQECWFHISKVLLFRECRHAIRTSNLALHHCLKFSQT